MGLRFWQVDEKGKVLSEKYLSWDIELGKHLNVTSKGKIDDFGFMYLHNMIQTADGSVYAVGEGFKKAASGLGIASKMLTRRPWRYQHGKSESNGYDPCQIRQRL